MAKIIPKEYTITPRITRDVVYAIPGSHLKPILRCAGVAAGSDRFDNVQRFIKNRDKFKITITIEYE